ncbi:hypothetical protein AVEN_262190-1 [Araneus ventricosus]|uniref:Alpha-ketoglutarate-dependent dioxygenase AlkB-like domain-containing protein n=1 Tax=Araneus ventricosus TaxID=182803 RepID=A0A4Y2AHJ5_ARAVE|nr:hypothetical protein AVEN_262190-1 [Araneus ventricosus]
MFHYKSIAQVDKLFAMSSPNITYIPNFFSQEESIEMFTKLSKCPFKKPIIKVWGKFYRPLRKSCSYGDMNLECEYSGHCELPLPWNRTMLKIKSDVEKKKGFEYNFVLLNFYESGHAKICAHKDDKPPWTNLWTSQHSALEPTVTLSSPKRDVNQCDKRWTQDHSCQCTIKMNGLILFPLNLV